jgi:hypothetical protein
LLVAARASLLSTADCLTSVIASQRGDQGVVLPLRHGLELVQLHEGGIGPGLNGIRRRLPRVDGSHLVGLGDELVVAVAEVLRGSLLLLTTRGEDGHRHEHHHRHHGGTEARMGRPGRTGLS